MPSRGALKSALMLLHMPSGARAMRTMPLPPDTHRLLQVVAGDAKAIEHAMADSGRDRDVIARAATFFIEQVLWHPHADSYRVLGAAPGADPAELKRNMSLLMSWLHPDVGATDEHAVFIARVTAAWNDLKTQERRDGYSSKLTGAAAPKRGKPTRGRSAPIGAHRDAAHLAASPGLMHRLLGFLRGSS